MVSYKAQCNEMINLSCLENSILAGTRSAVVPPHVGLKKGTLFQNNGDTHCLSAEKDRFASKVAKVSATATGYFEVGSIDFRLLSLFTIS